MRTIHTASLGTLAVFPPPRDLRHVCHLLLLLRQRLPRRRLPRVPAPPRTGKDTRFKTQEIQNWRTIVELPQAFD